jgi:hypothetical protein
LTFGKENFPMNTPDQTFKLQTQLSTWSGTKKVAGWLAISALALCAIGALLIFLGELRSVGDLSPVLFIVAICMLVRGQAKKKIGEIEAALSA